MVAGQFNEHVFRGLDFVLHEAAKRQIKLMLVIVNYWQAFGGMSQYVRQASLHQDWQPS